jgi:hypothetical protein
VTCDLSNSALMGGSRLSEVGKHDTGLFFILTTESILHYKNSWRLLIQCIGCTIQSLVWIEQKVDKIIEVSVRCVVPNNTVGPKLKTSLHVNDGRREMIDNDR